ncbi:MAG: M56 family metallopeptidase [Flavisolibacter sp.]
MANWSQSHILHSLGWATLNSFWQMALLWCLFLGASQLFHFSAQKKYQFSVLAIITGFAWFVFTFIYYYTSQPVTALAYISDTINAPGELLNIFLYSASLAYLGLLIFPSYKLYRNWRFIRSIRRVGLQKADYQFRLFVQKIASQLGISKKVSVYISDLARSPLTIGYFKPVILLPVAVLNNLNTQQVEAILLHELSHIKRFDYLVNFLISIINTVLYFNPFVKMFMRHVEDERENCCDQLVLQFGYDKVGYASALLTLETLSAHQQVLAIGATGKSQLISRIEKIVGLEKKKSFKKSQLAGMFAALFCILLFNSILIIRETKKQDSSLFTFNPISNPFNLYERERGEVIQPLVKATAVEENNLIPTVKDFTLSSGKASPEASYVYDQDFTPVDPVSPTQGFSYVGVDEVDASLTTEEKLAVKTMVENTRKVISGLQWSEIEKTIADVLSEEEKQKARQEYMKELEKTVDFKKLEQNLKAQYQLVDMQRINSNLDKAITMIQMDSIQKNYQSILVQLEKARVAADASCVVAASPMPDQSMADLQRSTKEMRLKVDSLKALKHPKKVVRL